MATVTQTRPVSKISPAVHGVTRLLQPIGDGPGNPGEISINGKAYLIGRLETCYRLGTYDAKKDEAHQYDLPFDFSSCTCADHTFRERVCKHMGSLAALKKAGKL